MRSRLPLRWRPEASVRAALLLTWIAVAAPATSGWAAAPDPAPIAVAADSAGSAPASPAADSATAAPAAVDTAAAPTPELGPGELPLVGRISVTGNTTAETDRITRSFGVVSGNRYSPDAVRRGIVKLMALGLFNDVWVEKQMHGDVLDLVIHVQERPRVTSIEFKGNKHKETSELEKKISIHTGEIYSVTAAQTQVDSLLRFYREEGYAEAHVTAEADTTGGPGKLVLRFVIQEGEKLQITSIQFVGASPENVGKIHKQIKSRARSFFGGGGIKDESFEEDRQKLETWYHSQGYRDMRVVSHEVKPGDSPRHVTLVFTVDEGRRYLMGRVTWAGNTIIHTDQLAANLRVHPLDRYDATKIERAQGLAYAAYSEEGYLSVSIEPRETVRDSVVDVTFTITEGPSSNIRYITITGNKNTREKVLRRELTIHEGDRFRRSALMRTRDDLMRLGIFEDIQPDLGAGDSTDVDIILKVKEKQVGTASAGAGYTGETGLTGFLELSHNNVLGNAQTASLHLERGPKRSDYFLSFTEPWFHDTPTLLGYSIYNNSIDRDFYREGRAGGSAKIGRPLPWPDYSRGALTYTLEQVTIKDIDTTAAKVAGYTDSLYLASLSSGKLTSTLAFDFNRNSTNEPFYPKRGTRLLGYSQFAGGPLGGDISFNKHRLEGRLYVPSIFRGVTTMLRTRLGFLGAFPNGTHDVPAYERFRLGGGSTTDPLRGYDDYQVVPSKFVHEVLTPIYSPDTTIKVPIAYNRSFVRYPGGRFFTTYTVEEQFPVVHPLHAVVFFDAGNTWDLLDDIKPFDLKMGAGLGFRLEIPLLGNIGFDYAYGFNRDDGPKFKGHFLLGNVNF